MGEVAAGASRTIDVPIAFSPACDNSSTFLLNAVFSSDNGAYVGTLVNGSETH
jgi:hypothetical protein